MLIWKIGSALIDVALPGPRRRQEALATYGCSLFTATIQETAGRWQCPNRSQLGIDNRSMLCLLSQSLRDNRVETSKTMLALFSILLEREHFFSWELSDCINAKGLVLGRVFLQPIISGKHH